MLEYSFTWFDNPNFPPRGHFLTLRASPVACPRRGCGGEGGPRAIPQDQGQRPLPPPGRSPSFRFVASDVCHTKARHKPCQTAPSPQPPWGRGLSDFTSRPGSCHGRRGGGSCQGVLSNRSCSHHKNFRHPPPQLRGGRLFDLGEDSYPITLPATEGGLGTSEI